MNDFQVNEYAVEEHFQSAAAASVGRWETRQHRFVTNHGRDLRLGEARNTRDALREATAATRMAQRPDQLVRKSTEFKIEQVDGEDHTSQRPS